MKNKEKWLEIWRLENTIDTASAIWEVLFSEMSQSAKINL